MTILDRFPYDILRAIFDCLDIETLLDACLASHALNEVASWSLYTSITFNPDAINGSVWYVPGENYENRRNPIQALERRPHLRMAVRHVILCAFHSYGYTSERNSRLVKNCIEALVLLPNITSLQVINFTLKGDWDLLSNSLLQLRNLQNLIIQSDNKHIGLLPHLNSTDIHAELSPESIVGISASSMAHKLRSLGMYYFYGMTIQELSLRLQRFSRLTRFSAKQHLRLSPSELCELVAAVPSLREALFTCDINKENDNIVPTGAKRLTYLHIHCHRPKHAKGDGILKLLVQCVAGQSQLQRLDIIAGSAKPNVLNADRLLAHVLSLHGRTLKKLKFPSFHLSSLMFGQVLSRCERLTNLWVGMAPGLRARLPELLAKSKTLETLSVFAEGTWNLMHAQSILCQTCPTLRQFKVCGKHGSIPDKFAWKVYWTFDNLLAKPVLQIDGPDSVDLTPFTGRKQYMASCTGSEYDGEEMEVDT